MPAYVAALERTRRAAQRGARDALDLAAAIERLRRPGRARNLNSQIALEANIHAPFRVFMA